MVERRPGALHNHAKCDSRSEPEYNWLRIKHLLAVLTLGRTQPKP
jgi:hypothetical protein